MESNGKFPKNSRPRFYCIFVPNHMINFKIVPLEAISFKTRMFPFRIFLFYNSEVTNKKSVQPI